MNDHTRWTLALVLIVACLGSGIVTFASAADGPWEGNITIQSDGSVTPSDAPVKMKNSDYWLTDEVLGSVTILASGITFKGDGHGLTGSAIGNGITLNTVTGVTVKDLSIIGFYHGVYLYSSDENTVKDLEVCYNLMRGIWADYSDYNEIKTNDVHHNTAGIYLGYSTYNTIKGNSIHDNSGSAPGVYLTSSHHNEIKGNAISGSYWGIRLASSYYTTLKGNDVCKSVYGVYIGGSDYCYLIGNSIHENTGPGAYLYYSYYCDIKDNEVYKNQAGIYLSYCIYNTVDDNAVELSTYQGIYIYYSNYNDIYGNDVEYNRAGIRIERSTYNDIYDNFACNNYVVGIYSEYSTYCNIFENTASGSLGFSGITDSGCGIWIFHDSYDKIFCNEVGDNYNIGMNIDDASSNEIDQNVIKDNYLGIHVDGNENMFFYNDLFDNGDPQAQDDGESNVWDDGAGMGNYWSDYEGSDTDGDGIGDTDLPHTGVDYYPLMEPYN